MSTAAPAGAARAAEDPLHGADPVVAADQAAIEPLLRAWVRETGASLPPSGSRARLPLPGQGTALLVPVLHRSASGWHRFGRVRRERSGGEPGPELPHREVATLLLREAALQQGRSAAAADAAIARARDSAGRIAEHLDDRWAHPEDPTGERSFRAGEQALTVGHPFHPAGKGREEDDPVRLRELSPELRGRLRLRWLGVRPTDLVGEGPGEEPIAETLRRMALDDGVAVPEDRVPLPLHPSQAARLLAEGPVADALAAGRLVDLGSATASWFPTSSLRTLERDGARWMAKLSLGLRITNSRRENHRPELRLGRHVGALATALEALEGHRPSVGVLLDAAWASTDVAGPGEEHGLALALRDAVVGAGDPTICLAGLVAERPRQGPSRLGAIVLERAAASGEPVEEAAGAWLDALLDVLVLPLLRWHDVHGVGVEAHAQNALVTLDPDGLPVRGWYRDGQGWYVARAHAAAWQRRLPCLEPEGCQLVFDDDLVADRVAYYLGVNALLGVVGALGADGVADERALLARIRDRLEPVARARPDGVAARLRDAPTLTSKCNLLTTVDGRDELDGPVATQSVYREIPNPIARA
ncbi:IucA/IucC family protein [Patulibacter brassicae]|uniref:IucA/IucC family protein n=1 Tax=Patulibacter brassicae TaxID=1705717 RepID=A0ABU4VFX9_9ACTN|nr:IucA/IucC family protein [Patulibacter brassicae]MDX8150731.1 IucA/IucC family protein [Patulibacter brassicae]